MSNYGNVSLFLTQNLEYTCVDYFLRNFFCLFGAWQYGFHTFFIVNISRDNMENIYSVSFKKVVCIYNDMRVKKIWLDLNFQLKNRWRVLTHCDHIVAGIWS